jgi:hypothetical protein
MTPRSTIRACSTIGGRDGQIELDPDQEVQGAIRTIFGQFERLGTVTAVLHFFHDHGLTIPRRRWHVDTGSEIVWMRPSYQAIHTVLLNPIYTGAYVYGRRGHDPSGSIVGGTPGPRKRVALEQVEVLLRNHHPAYVSWERYLANRAQLRDNSTQFQPSRGAPRQGAGLLQGLVVCGQCGCRMQVQYRKPSPAYICDTRHRRYGEPLCQSLTSDHVDRAISEAFLQVIEPVQVEAALTLAEDLERDRATVEHQWELRLERARYEAERAFRQYDLCEPENRLAARDLEGRWNKKLRAVAELESECQREQDRGLAPLTDEERAILRHLVGNVRALWEAAARHMEERKRLVRCLIREVVLYKDEQPRGQGGITTIRIGWCSGAWSELQAQRPSAAVLASTPQPILERIRDLAQRHPDDAVAAILHAEGLRTKRGLAWTYLRVGLIRLRHGIPTACPIMPTGPEPRGDGRVSVDTIVAQVVISRSVVGTWCRCGFLDVEQLSPLGPPGWDASGTGTWPLATPRSPARVGPEPGGALPARAEGEADRLSGAHRGSLGVARRSRRSDAAGATSPASRSTDRITGGAVAWAH